METANAPIEENNYAKLNGRRRLMRMYCDDPTAHSWFLVGRCSAGLAIVALIAVFGFGALHTTLASSQAASVKASRGAVAE